MERRHLAPLWTAESEILPRKPEPSAIPWLWKWSQLRRLAMRAGDLVTIERGGDRRALGLANPGLGGQPFTTPTLWAAVQWLNGREVEPAHRHSAQAVRFMIEGKWALYSTVHGRQNLSRARRFRHQSAHGLARPWERGGRACRLDGRPGHPAEQLLEPQAFLRLPRRIVRM